MNYNIGDSRYYDDLYSLLGFEEKYSSSPDSTIKIENSIEDKRIAFRAEWFRYIEEWDD